MKQPHSGLVRACRDWLTLHGWFVYPNKMSMGSYKGLSDLTAIRWKETTHCLARRSVWIECKVGKDKLSSYQIIFQSNIEANGGEYLVVKDIDDLMDLE